MFRLSIQKLNAFLKKIGGFFGYLVGCACLVSENKCFLVVVGLSWKFLSFFPDGFVLFLAS